MQNEYFTLIVPTYNMSNHINLLWKSIKDSQLIEYLQEIIFVNDGSTDETFQLIDKIKSEDIMGEKISIINLNKNHGRFLARYIGAKSAKTKRILFLDSRIKLPIGFGYALINASAEYGNIIGNVDIDVTRNIFCLYWERSHKKIFSKHYKDANNVIILTPDNYDNYLKGTGIFFCSKILFLGTCEKFNKTLVLSDDTYLMKEMVREEPLIIHPNVRISWVPRENFYSFLARLWERGPSFVEYHVFEHRGIFFWIVMIGLIILFSLLTLTFVNPYYAFYLFLFLISTIFLSTALLAKNTKEFFLMAPLHFCTVVSFGMGVVYGFFVNIKKIFLNKFL